MKMKKQEVNKMYEQIIDRRIRTLRYEFVRIRARLEELNIIKSSMQMEKHLNTKLEKQLANSLYGKVYEEQVRSDTEAEEPEEENSKTQTSQSITFIPRHHKKWREADDRELKKVFRQEAKKLKQGMTKKEMFERIAKIMGRKPSAIYQRLPLIFSYNVRQKYLKGK